MSSRSTTRLMRMQRASITRRDLGPDLGAAVATVAVAAAIRWALIPLLGSEAPLMIFGGMAAALTFWGGLGPGILASALGTTVGTLLFVRPLDAMTTHSGATLESSMFFVETVFVCYLIYRVRAGQETAEAVHRRRDDSFAFVAHELRHPLSTIQLAAATLARDKSAEARERAAQLITRSASRLARVIDDLVDLTRVQSETLSVRLRPIDLLDPLQAALEVARPGIAARHQLLLVDLGDGPLPVEGDTLRLQQVFANLLSNACKYSPEGSELHVSAQLDADAVVVSVRDTGLGIKRDMLDHIFEPFVREPGGAADGLGLGLTLARTLVERHGGQLTAYSDGPGRGSEFRLVLPAAIAPSAAPAGAPQL